MIFLLRLWEATKGYLILFGISGIVAAGILITGYRHGYHAAELKGEKAINALKLQLATIASQAESIKKDSLARDEFNRKLQENLGNEANTLRRNLSDYYRMRPRVAGSGIPDGLRGEPYSPGITMSATGRAAGSVDAQAPKLADDTAGNAPGRDSLKERCAQDALSLILLQEWVRGRR